MPLVTLDFNALVYSGTGDTATTADPVAEEGFTVSNPHGATLGTLRSSAGFNRHDTNDDTPFAPAALIGGAQRISQIDVTKTDAETFDLVSLELDSFLTGTGGTIAITGNLAGGGTVEHVVALDTINSSQVFTLPESFRNLVSFSVTGLGDSSNFQFDNIVLRDYSVLTDGADNVLLAAPALVPAFIRFQGGDDTVSMAAEGFETSNNLIIDGGAGSDTISLNGSRTFTLGGGPVQNITNFETFALSAGSYNITMADAFLAATQSLTVTMSTTNATQTLVFNGAAETFGRFILSGGLGNDTLVGGAGNDTVNTGGDGSDQIYGLGGDDTMVGGAGSDHLRGGTGNDQLFGSSGLDILEGDEGNDTLDGGSGNDTVFGGDGNDVISDAGFDNDEFYGGSGDDLMFSFEGTDLLHGNEGDDTMFAGDDDDTLFGGSGNDEMNGGAQNDYLDGGFGIDEMTGGIGNDTFIVDSNDDIVIEADGGGTDRVAALSSYGLAAGAYVELLDALNSSSTTALNLAGNELNQTIIGNNGNNVLTSGGGSDVMIGLGGNDTFLANAGAASTMNGNLGNDVYFVAHAADVVSEAAGEGNDRVAAAISYVLTSGSSVETLETVSIAATTAINLTGNMLNQFIIGNNGNNTLIGGGGNDHLIGAGGNDTLIGSSSASALEGGLGNDVYFISDGSDFVIELLGGGADRVAASVSYTLPGAAEVEMLEAAALGSTTALNFTGNAFNNTLIGNNGANVLDGKDSGDVLVGAGGNDTFAFTTGLGGGNVDRIDGFVTGADKVALDDAIFTALSGSVPAGAFVLGSAAGDADDRIIYHSATGALFYDPDGTGPTAQVQFATLNGGPAIAATDFIVV